MTPTGRSNFKMTVSVHAVLKIAQCPAVGVGFGRVWGSVPVSCRYKALCVHTHTYTCTCTYTCAYANAHIRRCKCKDIILRLHMHIRLVIYMSMHLVLLFRCGGFAIQFSHQPCRVSGLHPRAIRTVAPQTQIYAEPSIH